MAHGLWRNSAIWLYLQSASRASTLVSRTLASIVSPSLIGLGAMKISIFTGFVPRNFNLE